jgi:hypothetical protein
MHITLPPSPQPLILATSDTDTTRLTEVFNNRIYCFSTWTFIIQEF